MTIRRFPRSRQSALPYPATLDLSFIGRDTLDPRITFTRADATTCATYFDAAGVLQTAAANVPRFDYNPSTLAAQGLLIEESRTNSIRNNTMQGAAAGTPGTLPTNWTGSTTVDGLSREVVGTGTENGIAYIDVRFSGTSGAAGNSTLLTFEGQTQVVAANGQTWTASAYLKLAAGALTNVALFAVAIRYNNSGGTSLTAQNTTLTPTASLTRYTNTLTATDATTAFVNGSLVANFTNSSAVDFTVRIGLPQLEQGAFATSVILTSSGAVTRAADVASITELAPWYNASSGTLFAEFSAPASGTRTMADLNDTTATESIRLRTVSTNPFFTVTDGTDQADIDAGTVASNTAYKFAGAYAANDFATCINGGTVQTDNSGTLPAITQMILGADASGNALNGYLRRLTYYPVRLSNTDLQAITA